MSNNSSSNRQSTSVLYRIDLANFGQDHTLDIEATFDVAGLSDLEIFLPVWTPGSYLIREYARNIESISIKCDSDESQASIEKIRKNAWRLTLENPVDSVTVCYRLYAREKSVRTNWVERAYAFLVGSGTFVSAKRFSKNKHIVQLTGIPEHYKIDSSLAIQASKDATVLTAHDYDELIDSPILIGKLTIDVFEVGGKRHRLVSVGNLKNWDNATATKHTAAIVEAVQDFWQDVPYSEYSFQNLIIGGYGGLEHDNCCVLMTDPNAMINRSSYVDWLGLVSHEFFHTWNVRRLRPKALHDYDYENEQYLRELWIAEGITSYFDDLLVLRAGLCNETEFLSRLSKTVNTVMSAPGRNIQSLEDSSFDTWIKHYRPDENTNNSRISYYTKGACVAWLLDVQLAQASGFSIRLDDVMRELWNRYRNTGYTNKQFETLVSEMVPGQRQDWFDSHVRGVGDLDFSPALEQLGLRWKQTSQIDKRSALEIAISVPEMATTKATIEIATLGCDVRDSGGRILVERTTRGGAANKAGLLVEDEILGINDVRVTFATFNKVLQSYRVGDKIRINVVRRELIDYVELTLNPPSREWQLEVCDDASEATSKNRQKWLSGQ